MVTSRSKLKAKLDRPKDEKHDLSKQLVRFVERDDSLTPNYRVLKETTMAQMIEDFKLVSDPKYTNRFFPTSNCFSDIHNREVTERRKTKKVKLAEAKQLAEQQELEHSQNGSEKPTQRSSASSPHLGPPPKILSGSKRSVWAGSERSAVRAWDAGDRSWSKNR